MDTNEGIRAKDILPHKTSFGPGDGFYGDGNTSFFMEANNLLKLIAENVLAKNARSPGYEVPAGGVIAYMPSQVGSHFVCSYRYGDSPKNVMVTGFAMVTYTASGTATYRNINYIQSPSALECPLKMMTDGTRVAVVNNLSVGLQVSFISCAGNWNYPKDNFSYPTGWVSESAVEVGSKNPVMPLDRVHSSKVRDGGVGNNANPNKVTSTCVYCDPNYTYVVYIDRPLQSGHRYEFGYSLSSDVNDVGKALEYNSPSKIVTVDAPKYKVGNAISFKDYPTARAVCIEIMEYDENNNIVPLRLADFFGYSITLIPISAYSHSYEVPAGGVIAYMPSQVGSHFVCSYRYSDSAKNVMITGFAMVTYTTASSDTYRNINYIQSPSAFDCPLKMMTDGTRVAVINNLSMGLQVSFISCAGNWNYPKDNFSYPTGWVSESTVEIGARNPVMPFDRVHSSKVRNGGVGNNANPNKVTSTCVYCDVNYNYVVYIDRPLQSGHRYEFGYSLSSDVNDVGVALGYNSPSKIVTVDSPKYKVGEPIDLRDYPSAKAICIEINEFDENDNIVPLRQEDFFGYSITLIPVQKEELAYALDETLDYSLLNVAARINYATDGSKDFCSLIVTDSHDDNSSVSRAIGYTGKSSAASALVHCGDYVGSYVTYGQSSTNWATAVSGSNKPTFFVQGNHEKGTFYNIRTTPSDATLYNLFVRPIVDKGYLSLGEYEVGKCYYYHDFSTLKTRLIVLDEYRVPTDYDETYWQAITYDSTLPNIADNTDYAIGNKVNIPNFTANSFQAVQAVNTGAYYSGKQPCYRCRKGYRYIDQTEAQWFLDTLYSTPSDYQVVVAMHNPFSDLAVPDKTKKFCQKVYVADNITGADWAQNYMATDFVADALNSFKTGISYSATISTKSNSEAAYISDYSVAKDFSARGEGKLGLIIGGHVHRDVVWKHPTYSYMFQVTPMCSITTSSDNNRYADIRLQNDSVNDVYVDSITAFSVADGERIALAKLGCKYTTDALVRDIEVL